MAFSVVHYRSLQVEADPKNTLFVFSSMSVPTCPACTLQHTELDQLHAAMQCVTGKGWYALASLQYASAYSKCKKMQVCMCYADAVIIGRDKRETISEIVCKTVQLEVTCYLDRLAQSCVDAVHRFDSKL